MRKSRVAKPAIDSPLLVLSLAIVYLLTISLKPDPRNARCHSESQIKALAKSISTFGFLIPIVIDAECMIIAGHARWLAAKLIGLEKVPTIRVDHLTSAQRRAFAIADNRLAELATWDEQILAESFKILSEADINFDFETIGYEDPEIDLIIEGVRVSSNKVDPADNVSVRLDPAVSQSGDQWNLERHRIRCGNALQSHSFAKLLGSAAASIVFGDAPYNVSINHHASTARGRINYREFLMASGEMSAEEYVQFLAAVFALLIRYSKPGSLHFQCIDWRHVDEMLDAGKKPYGAPKQFCVWVKSNGGMGSLYRNQHELILVFKNGDAPHRNNVQLGRHGRNRSNVWTYPSPNAFGKPVDKNDSPGEHPTPKPTALVADVLMDASRRGDIVLDPFLGSGTTVIAAERTGRICYGLEIDPLYVDAAVRRWEAYTGKTARHASGATFAEIARQRGGKDA